MALGQVGKPNNILLDSLIQLSDIIKSLNGDELIKHIEELKNKTQEFNDAKNSAGPALIALQEKTAKHEAAFNAANAEKLILANVKAQNDAQLNHLGKLARDLEGKIQIHEASVLEKSREIQEKETRAADRERKAEEKYKLAEARVSEYEAKLADLKKITG